MTFRAKQKFGKYRILRRISSGHYADVYAALDTIEGVRVALKMPHPSMVTPEMLNDFRSEVRVTAMLSHPNIVSIKSADFIEERFVIAYPLGVENLADRLTRRIALVRCYDYAEQLLAALAHAHAHHVIHCDVKPENVILFADGQIRLTDFGISRVAQKTLQASGSGTVGYIAPEQALGRPHFQSDVFSAAVVLYQMVTRQRPEWPFRWPLPGAHRLRQNAPPEFVLLLRRSLDIDYRKRFADAGRMELAFRQLKPAIERFFTRRRARRRRTESRR